jgi:hypothetical protein
VDRELSLRGIRTAIDDGEGEDAIVHSRLRDLLRAHICLFGSNDTSGIVSFVAVVSSPPPDIFCSRVYPFFLLFGVSRRKSVRHAFRYPPLPSIALDPWTRSAPCPARAVPLR